MQGPGSTPGVRLWEQPTSLSSLFYAHLKTAAPYPAIKNNDHEIYEDGGEELQQQVDNV